MEPKTLRVGPPISAWRHIQRKCQHVIKVDAEFVRDVTGKLIDIDGWCCPPSVAQKDVVR